MDKQPTIIDVARVAGVSKATVSRVLRGEDRVSDQTRSDVMKAVKKVGYRPNIVARSLKERVASVFGFVTSDLSNPYYADILRGVYQAAAGTGFQIIIASGDESSGGAEAAIGALREFRVSGLILASPSLTMRQIAKLTDGLPAVIEGHANAPAKFDVVTSDDIEGARLLVDHLVQLGHRRMVVLEDTGLGGFDRLDGFARAFKRAQLSSSVRHIPTVATAEGGYESMKAVLARGKPPTAVLCDNDIMAVGAMSAIEEANMSVPKDISVTGFDDIAMARLRQFDLTTVRQDRWAIGRLCFEVLHRRVQIEDKQLPGRIILKPTLKVRGSTGPVRS
ncbi:MAG: LacI family DNA-binding transcriptional regulator [Actinobacteria bacterium]|uniref:Unannotated protein n=1 Tax=freshwater metagenome TaxID=449393 RepID=A0A6J5YT15_9ZZZZ|nr:LacI family DNA-binding transcriptional regulator [Actinomycetota bacterium]